MTFNLCISHSGCAFHTCCTHTPEINDLHTWVCDNTYKLVIDRYVNQWPNIAVVGSRKWAYIHMNTMMRL